MNRAMSMLRKQDARHRIAVSAAVAAGVWLALNHRILHLTQSLATWDAFALCLLVLAWFTIISTPQKSLRARAQEQDFSRTLIFFFVIAAACAGLFAVGFLYYTNKNSSAHFGAHLILSLLAIVSAWSLVHTVFGLRYAHKFYGDDDDPKTDTNAGGLQFPGENAPDYFDFAYFSFVIGMTFQVSDVQITSQDFRRLVLVHSVLSFAFNTVILALTVNTVSSLL